MPLRIENYALIADTHTAALVGLDGSIDWLCLPRFDSPACMAHLVGSPDNGRWIIAPDTQEKMSVRRAYRPDTMVLETEFTTAEGTVRLIDFMPRSEGFHRADLLRIVEGVRGKVTMRMELSLRFGYGRTIPWIQETPDGICALAGPDAIHVCAPVPMKGDNRWTESVFEVSEGQRVPFSMIWFPAHEPIPETLDSDEMLRFTEQWWRNWSAEADVAGPWREPVLRSLLTLKALTYSPSGGIVAAPTLSLPEKIGGVRNWDYRFCWLRDAALTLDALMIGGFRSEAMDWSKWLLRAVAGDPAQLQILYRIDGHRDLQERELTWLSGYEGSQPVREGNAAVSQLQLDVFGQIVDVISQVHATERNGPVINVRDLLVSLVDQVARVWRDPDEGLWEIRANRQHFTHSKVMCWVAVDRAIRCFENWGLHDPLPHWRDLRDEIHRDVCTRGFDPVRNTFTQSYGGHELDAALLFIPLVGFLPPDDARVRGTVEAVQRELGPDGLLYRYHWTPEMDGMPHGEGVFIACSFWLVEALCMIGEAERAKDLFERLLDLCNDVGLLAEEYDTKAARQVGNFPQAFSHIALITAAARLNHALGTGRPVLDRFT